VVLAAVVFALIGNPLELFGQDHPPAPPRVEPRWLLTTPIAPLTGPAVMPVTTPPPPVPGSFSVLIGTYDSARQVELVHQTLTRRQLPVYTIDLLMPAGDIERRVLVGRYATREEAEQVRAALEPAVIGARVIPGAQERLRVIP
jgi:cell division septation protein DedD